VTPFFDTNILVYAFLDVAKREAALNLIASGGVISAQVLNEFTNVARRKREREWAEIKRAVSVIRSRFADIVPLTADIHASALELARDRRLSFYDALIVAAALEAGCNMLYTEDMQHGGKFGGLTIINPFIEAGR
jgi:predicted nucleic acid-binding protein